MSRAERVRQRRTQQSQERQKRATHQIRYAAEAPQVIVRGGAFGTPVVNRTRSQARRKVAVPLGKTGAEMLMPAIPVFKPGWRILSAFLSLLFAALIMIVVASPEFAVQSLNISGLGRVSKADVESLLEITDTPIFMVDPELLKASLEKAYPELTNIAISVDLPASVSITLKERLPIIAWHYDEKTLWIDGEGALFPPRGEIDDLLQIESEETPPVVKLASPDSEVQQEETEEEQDQKKSSELNLTNRRLDPLVLDAALKLSQIRPSESALAFSSSNGLGWNDPNGWTVYLGLSFQDIDTKLLIYNTLVNQLDQQGVRPRMISVEHYQAPFYRLD